MAQLWTVQDAVESSEVTQADHEFQIGSMWQAQQRGSHSDAVWESMYRRATGCELQQKSLPVNAFPLCRRNDAVGSPVSESWSNSEWRIEKDAEGSGHGLL
jgi:hypothetical protein